MNNPNSKINKLKAHLKARWSQEDYPGGEPRFQLMLLAKDLGVFVLLPVVSIILFKSCENAATGPRKPNQNPRVSRDAGYNETSRSQIISFDSARSGGSGLGFSKRAPGTLVKVRLLNVVETFGTSPVHVQILDSSLGASLMGATMIGDAVPDPNFERITINFRFVRDNRREGVAATISARALSLDGTFGVVAKKKEGFVARSVLSSAEPGIQGAKQQVDSMGLKEMIAKALASGLLQEFGNEAQVARNRSQVLTLQPSTVFFAELTDFFPGGNK